jgi:transcription initiation factor TFIIIB Brf1 subunit/transcription initiation factor TFIIB
LEIKEFVFISKKFVRFQQVHRKKILVDVLNKLFKIYQTPIDRNQSTSKTWWYVYFFLTFFSRLSLFSKPRFCNNLELRQGNLIQKTAIFIAERAKEVCDIQSRAPESIASASIYMACAAAGERKAMKGKRFLLINNKKIFHIDMLVRYPSINWCYGKYNSTNI